MFMEGSVFVDEEFDIGASVGSGVTVELVEAALLAGGALAAWFLAW